MADAQFAIDIAAKMDGAQTLSELDQLTASLMGGGKNADVFQDAIARVSRQLDAAGAAAKVSNAALAEGEAEYARLERAALQVSKAAEKAAVKNGGVMPPEAVAFVRAGTDALAAQADKLRTLEADAKRATEAEDALSKTQKNLGTLNGHVNKSLAEQAEGFEKLRFGLQSAGGSLGALASRALAPVQGFAKLSASMGGARAAAVLGAASFVAIAAAAVALTAVVLAGVFHVAEWAVGLGDSAREAGLAQDAIEALHPALASVRGELGALENSTGLTQDRLDALGEALRKAGVGAKQLPTALRAAATAEAALGNGGAQQFVDQIAAGSLAVNDFAKQVDTKFGGIVAKRMLGLDAQTARFHRNIADLFGGLNIDPALSGLQTLVAMFDKSTVAGQALQFLFGTVFQPLIDHSEQAAQIIEAFYLGVLIGGVKLYLVLKPAIKAASELLGFKDTSFETTLATVTKVAEVLAPGLVLAVAGVVGLAAAFGALIGFAVILPGIMAAPFIAMIALAERAGTVLTGVVTSAINFIRGLDFGQIGIDIIHGIAVGIAGASAFVINALTGVVGGAIDHAKHLLGIASPSKVFAQLGGYTAEGFAGGVDKGAPAAQDAIAGMVEPPSPEAAKQAALSGDIGALGALSPATATPAAPASASGGKTVHIENLNLNGIAGAEDIAPRLSEILTRMLEGDATQLGSNLGATG